MPEIVIADASAQLLEELWQGMRDEHGETRTKAQLVDDAIKRVHRGFFGLPEGAPEGPERATGPFRKWASARWAEVLLRQVDAKTFRLAQPFRYDDGTMRFDVPEEDVTDLASVPRFLTWLVPRYGRHTLAALLHDNLQGHPTISPEQADEIFRDSMGSTGVPLTRRWLMWSAVAVRTQWKHGGLRSFGVFAWVAMFGLMALALWPVVLIRPVLSFSGRAVALSALAVVGAIVLAVALSFLWGRLWKVGALGAIALLFFTMQVLLVLIALGLYLGIEWLVENVVVKKEKRNPVLTRHL